MGCPVERKGRSVQGRIADSVIERSMGAVAVETATAEDHRTASTATETSAAATARATKSAATKAPSLLARVVEALLHFVSAHGIERVGSISRNRHGFGCAVR